MSIVDLSNNNNSNNDSNNNNKSRHFNICNRCPELITLISGKVLETFLNKIRYS